LRNQLWKCGSAGCVGRVFVFAALIGLGPGASKAQNVTLNIPVTKIPIRIKEQSIAIRVSGTVSVHSKDKETSIFDLELRGDLSELQANMTELLSSQLDKNDPCGEQITIQHGELVPAEPASVATVQLHYERWACAKILGKEKSKKLVGGDAAIEMKLTPEVEAENTELRLVPEVGKIDANGSLGELLRSGTLGDMLRDKIRSSILSALSKGNSLTATIPPAIQGRASIQKAEFKDLGSGRLMVVLGGEGKITRDEMRELTAQIKERVGK
jgi:hypothetical protein